MAMVSRTQNQTAYECCICLTPYEDKEKEKARKVVELWCHHYFHVDCFKQAISIQEKNLDSAEYRDVGLRCSYCNQIYATRGQTSNGILGNEQRRFKDSLKKFRQDYAYDLTAVKASLRLEKLYPELNSGYINHGKTQNFLEYFKDLVIEKIEEDLRADVCRVLGAILDQRGCLRTLEGEARRWHGIPLGKYPERIKREGVVVFFEDARVRVSADYLHRISNEVLIEDTVDSLKQRGDEIDEFIRSIPTKIAQKVYDFGASIFSLFGEG